MSRHLRTYLESCQQIEPLETNLLIRSENQVRSDLGDLSDLCRSIREHGLLQPIIVRPKGSRFEVICGNRRFEACRRLMKRNVDCIVRDLSDQDAFEISLVENIQRHTLSVVEEAKAFRKYVSEFGWGGVSDLSAKLGKSEEYVSHRILLLNLPNKILSGIERNEISASQAQELVWFKEESSRNIVFGRIEKERLSVAAIRKVRKDLEANENHFGPDAPRSRADFETGLGTRESDENLTTVKYRDKKVIEEAILGLRIALVRLDSAISKSEAPEVKDLLMKERFGLHGQIDRLIQAKTRMSD